KEPSRAAKPRKRDAIAGSSDAPGSSTRTSEPSPMEQLSPQDLLQRIAGAVQKESLESALRALPQAELKDDSVVLDLTRRNQFFLRQIRQNIAPIAQAASQIAGRSITISFLHELASPAKAAA